MLTVVRKESKQLVTALRIIEREELFVHNCLLLILLLMDFVFFSLDDYWSKKKIETGFMPSGIIFFYPQPH